VEWWTLLDIRHIMAWSGSRSKDTTSKFELTVKPITTDSLLLQGTRFYPCDVSIQHHQLRHLITSPGAGYIYFVEETRLFRLDLGTKKKDVVRELPFTASCIASGYGWLCAGDGRAGAFAVMKISDIPPPDSSPVPIRPVLRVEQFGRQIVNSISIHQVPGGDDSTLEEVAVITNNDHTVRVYSLTHAKLVTRLSFDFPMNHGSISPDGRYMMVVGDKEEAHLYKRTRNRTKSGSLSHDIPPITWSLLRIIPMHKDSRAEEPAAYFTTAWSSNGKLCAAASEHGYITLLDVTRFEDLNEDPTITVAQASQTSQEICVGSVRSMAFLPSPWDLLLWVEDSGKACLADLRDGLITRQVIDLDSKTEGLELVEIENLSEDYSDLPELEDTRAPATHETVERRSDADIVQANSDRWRWRPAEEFNSPEPIVAAMAGLTDDERQVLDGLRTTRQREEAERQRLTNSSSAALSASQRTAEVNARRERLAVLRREIESSVAQATPMSIRYGSTASTSIAATSSASTTATSAHTRQGLEHGLNSLIHEYEPHHAPLSDDDDGDDDDDADGDQSNHRADLLANTDGMQTSRSLYTQAQLTQLLRSAAAEHPPVEAPSVTLPSMRRSDQNPAPAYARVDSELRENLASRAQRARQRRELGFATGRPPPNRLMLDARDSDGMLVVDARIRYGRNIARHPPINGLSTTGLVVSQDGRTLYVSRINFVKFTTLTLSAAMLGRPRASSKSNPISRRGSTGRQLMCYELGDTSPFQYMTIDT
jgi:hypothetical protein